MRRARSMVRSTPPLLCTLLASFALVSGLVSCGDDAKPVRRDTGAFGKIDGAPDTYIFSWDLGQRGDGPRAETSTKADKGSGQCLPLMTVCLVKNECCDPNADCQLSPDDTNCCIPKGGPCNSPNNDCCGFMDCSSSGLCACRTAGSTCAFSGECCAGSCNGGTCS